MRIIFTEIQLVAINNIFTSIPRNDSPFLGNGGPAKNARSVTCVAVGNSTTERPINLGQLIGGQAVRFQANAATAGWMLV